MSIFDLYIDKVISPILPNAKLGWWIGNNINLFNPQLLHNSRYAYEVQGDITFLHFTSINSLLEIIRSKTIRMSDFNSFSDPFELSHANKNLVDVNKDFSDYKSRLFALSMCEDTEENLNNNYMWNNYAVRNFPHKGVCIKLKLHKEGLRFIDFFLGKIQYCKSEKIDELVELKKRHKEFIVEYGNSIGNLDEVLLTICSFYKKADPFINENEIRLLAYIHKYPNHIHTNKSHPIRHKYCIEKNQIEYFFELPLEHSQSALPPVPKVSIEEVILGRELYGNEIGKLIPVIKYEFENSFNRKMTLRKIPN